MRKANWRISRCCMIQNCTAFVNSSKQKSLRRIHGLQLPLHPQQVVGWIALFGIAVGTFTVVLPLLGPNFQPVAFSLLGITFLLHCAAHLVALLLDPADPQVRAQSSTKILPEFDRTKHLHVIENGRCHLCNINTTDKRTKHCSICNKCIAQFDHHCKWLNNCIGGRNYPAFIVCVVSAVISALVVTAVSVTEIALINIDGNLLSGNVNMNNVTSPFTQLPGTGSLIVISLVGIISAIAAALLIHLCFFHGYIACLGLTTYEYVRKKRERKIAKGAILSEENHRTSNSETRCPSFCNDISNNERLRYQFPCKSLSPDEHSETKERSVCVCSTHQRQSCANDNTGNKDRRNFHLYFSYETHDSETSIEVSSQTILDNADRRQESIEFKPSTPSPVSCCFSITNFKSNSFAEKRNKYKEGQQQKSVTPDKGRSTRSCLTVKRIQSFLRTKLRRNIRKRSLNNEISRARRNKINPSLENDDSVKENDSSSISPNPSTTRDEESTESRPAPLKLPPLVFPQRHRIKKIPSSTVISTVNPLPIAIAPPKRIQQPPLRIRRTSFYKRPRFKMGSHVTETAQLSPIPESEFSKPASPRTPPQINHFLFPPDSSANENDIDTRDNRACIV